MRVEQIELHASGNVFVKWRKEVLRDGEVISSIPHREVHDPNNVRTQRLIAEHMESVKAAATETLLAAAKLGPEDV